MKKYGKGDITEKVYRKKIDKYDSICEFAKKRPNIVEGFRDYFEEWINSDVSHVIERRSGRKAEPVEILFCDGNKAYTDGKKISIPLSYGFPFFVGSSTHERLHSYSKVDDNSAGFYNKQKLIELSNIFERGEVMDRKFILDFLKNLSEKHFNSLVEYTISELIAHTETEPVLKEARIPFGIDVKPYLDKNKGYMKNYEYALENSPEKEVLITPESFYNELESWFSYHLSFGDVADFLQFVIGHVSTPFSQYARIINGFDEMHPSELWSLKSKDFVENYNKKIKKIKAKL